MAIAYVQGAAGGVLNSSVQSVTVTLGAASTAGNLLLAGVSVKHTGTTFTPPSGWLQLATVAAQVQTLTLFWYVGNPGSLSSFVFTMTDTADGMAAIVAEFSGAGAVVILDKSANANSASSTTMDSGTTATTTNAGDLWFGMLAYGSGGTKTISGVTNSFTAPAALIADATIAGNAHGAHVSGYYKIPGVTGTADVGATLSGASTSVGLMVTLIPTVNGVATLGGTGGVKIASQALGSALVGGSGGIGSASAQSLASATVGGSGGVLASSQSLASVTLGGSGGISTLAQSFASVTLGGSGGISVLAQSLASVALGGTGGVSAAAMVTVANLPKVLIGATVRDGKITATVRDGKTTATVRDGKVNSIVR